MNKTLLILCSMAIALSCTTTEKNYTQWVDPTIGTGGHGHVFMGANVPFGAVQLGPVNISSGWDWCSGYHVSDTTIMGFAHTHLSGTGIGDLNDIIFMPVVGDVELAGDEQGDYSKGKFSRYSHSNEKARAGYYSVSLDRYGIDVELTATKRVGMHRYHYPEGGNAEVVIDLGTARNWDKATECCLQLVSPTRITGHRFSRGWADDQKIYFAADFSQPIAECLVSKGDTLVAADTLTAQQLYGLLRFDLPTNELLVKVAVSPVSTANAIENMECELNGWDFDATAKAADKAWNDELSKVEIQSTDTTVMRTFYTALYHTMIAPSLYQDCNGDYRGADKQIHRDTTFVNYTTFSLWDTYRAAHPLMTIVHPEKMNDIVNTMLHIFDQQGELPVWHLTSCETHCMVGNPGASVVGDAIMKGYNGFDVEHAYQAMRTSAMNDGRGMNYMKQYGYIPYDLEPEALSKCMEYAIADWSVAQVAKKLGHDDDYRYFDERSKAYRYYFDKSINFVRGRGSDDSFRQEPLNPFESRHRENDYTEGNAWQYTWLVPHDVEGLIEQFGSKEAFEAKLDSLFVVTGDLGAEASPDISGLIGQYAHGNEPSHHVAYLYQMIGSPEKTARLVRQILTTLYHDQPDGLCGNEDVGQMSAWYVLSSLGFYQVEPAGGRYWFGSPLMDKATIKVGNDKRFIINVLNNSKENCIIDYIELNGEPYALPYIDFATIMAGGELTITMKQQAE